MRSASASLEERAKFRFWRERVWGIRVRVLHTYHHLDRDRVVADAGRFENAFCECEPGGKEQSQGFEERGFEIVVS
jgi:hypothetical protein